MGGRAITTGGRIGSLFAGIGGLELGLERAGLGSVAWQVEIEPYPRAVLERRWPEAKRFEDVRTVGAHNLPPVEVICGGFPCQDISNAGKRAGLEGARSGLWFEYLRIVRELRPLVVIAENVAALRTRGLPVVVAGLEDAGYRVVVHQVAAADVGAPHLRKRLFICAVRDDVADPAFQPKREPADEADAIATCREARHVVGRGGELADRDGGRCEVERERDGDAAQPGQQAPLRHDADRCDPAVADTRSARGAAGFPRPDARQEGLAGIALDGRDEAAGRRTHRPAEPRMGRAPDGISIRVDGVAGHAREVGNAARWPSRPTEPQHDWEAPRTAFGVPKRAHRLKALGNAVVPQVAEAVGRWVLDWLPSATAGRPSTP